jgi:predicted nuclease of predicted toxin-antitoxin system
MMQFKIDENLHADTAGLLRQHGHDALTVFEQGLRGYADTDIATVCQQEARAIVTLDLDFSDIRIYPPTDYHGIIVLRVSDQSRASILQVLGRIIPLFGTEPLAGRLWIVNEHQVRIRE